MDAAWIGVIGALLGTMLGSISTWLIDRDRWSHQERFRWQSDRREAYSRFLQASEAYERVVFDLKAQDGAADDPWAVDRQALDEAYREFQRATGEVRLMASAETAGEAIRLALLLVPAFGDLMPDHPFGPYGWAAVDIEHPAAKISNARAMFVQAARRELGLRAPLTWANLPSHVR